MSAPRFSFPTNAGDTPSYLGALRAATPSAREFEIVSRLQRAILEVAQNHVADCPDTTLQGTHLVFAGSTSRGVHLGIPCDFDLVLRTALSHEQVALEVVQELCRFIVRDVQSTAAFADYREIAFASLAVAEGRIEQGPTGERGPNSFVVRFDMVTDVTRTGFLDITIGKTWRLVGYENWFQALLHQLGDVNAARLQAEIRLAKKVLGGRLYGGAVGLRGNAIEQFVIQSKSANAALPVGTFGAALLTLIQRDVPETFHDFKTRCPLLRPQIAPPPGESPRTDDLNLWDQLGKGDAAAAEAMWRDLIGIARRYRDLCDSNAAWTIEDLSGGTGY